ncbi:MAG: hypothetical protein II625_04670 [Bacilli bacterium]|nr:hypothetical protein [Bacilli bacterium]
MKKSNYITDEERLKVTKEEEFKTQYDKDIEENDLYWKRLKTRALAVLLAGVIGLNAYGIYKWAKNSPEPTKEPSISYDVTDCVEPEVVTRYVAPSGYTLTWIDGVPYAIKEITTKVSPTKVQTEDGKTIYTAPAGYVLTTIDGEPVAVSTEKIMISPSVVTEYKAPEGYILVGDKCYKIDSDTPDYAAPEGCTREGLKCTKDSEATQGKGK